MARWSRTRQLVVVGLFLLLGVGLSSGKETDAGYPIGTSVQKWNGRKFTIHMPAEFPDEDGGYSLIVTLEGGLDRLKGLAAHRYVIMAVHTGDLAPDKRWPVGDLRETRALISYVVKRLRIQTKRLHVVGVSERAPFWTLAFGKESPFVSATLVDCDEAPGSIGDHLKKQMGVLALRGEGEAAAERQRRAAGKLKFKDPVRTVEAREDPTPLAGEYHRYWLLAMEGQFVPGQDRSLRWDSSLQLASELPLLLDSRDTGALIWFWSPDDKDDAGARVLQTEVFHDHRVRELGELLLPYRLQREKAPKVFEAFGLKRTPAVVVMEKRGRKTVLQGKITTIAMIKALTRAAKGSANAPWRR